MPERIVRPGILTSDPINSLSWPAECFYRRLMSVVDDYGRFDGRVSVLRANCYPLKLDHVSDADVRKWRSETVEAGVVSVYEVEGKEYVQVEKFNQRMRGKPRWPAPTRGDSPQVAASCSTFRLSSQAQAQTETQAHGAAVDGLPDRAAEFIRSLPNSSNINYRHYATIDRLLLEYGDSMVRSEVIAAIDSRKQSPIGYAAAALDNRHAEGAAKKSATDERVKRIVAKHLAQKELANAT